MASLGRFAVCCLAMLAATSVATDEGDDTGTESIRKAVTRLSEQARAVMEHYKQEDPIGLPGAPIPDPMVIPKIKKGIFDLKNLHIYGLSKFKIEKFDLDLDNMHIASEVSYANVTLAAFFGWLMPRSFSFMGALVKCEARLKVDTLGKLEVSEIKMGMHNREISSGSNSSGLQGLRQLAFNLLKPFVLQDAENTIRKSANDELRNLQTFPTSIDPIDLAFAKGRKFVRDSGYDPYKFGDYHYSGALVAVNVSNIVVTGLSSFYRTGDVSVRMRNNTLRIGVAVATQRMTGSCEWQLSLVSIPTRSGASKFSIEHLRVTTYLNQSLDVRNSPGLEELIINLGNIQLRTDGLGTLDYVLELAVNFLPNILRSVIVDTLQGHLKGRIQDVLQAVDVEREIENVLKNLEQETGSEIRLDPPENPPDTLYD